MNGVITAIDRLGNALLKAEQEIARLQAENDELTKENRRQIALVEALQPTNGEVVLSDVPSS